MKIRKSFLLVLLIPLIVFVCSKVFASWDNSNFLNSSFWFSYPTNSDIIVALFGDGNG